MSNQNGLLSQTLCQ